MITLLSFDMSLRIANLFLLTLVGGKGLMTQIGPILAQFVATKHFANTSCNRHVTCRVVRTQAFKSLQCFNLKIEVDELVELIPALVLYKKDVLIYLSLSNLRFNANLMLKNLSWNAPNSKGGLLKRLFIFTTILAQTHS